ncbi:MAG: DUF1232 domain-containing protein [Desulfobacteraceae bacterium]|nr:DUF1232 domain-containing protein [Desulfobacteraceae bacterium]
MVDKKTEIRQQDSPEKSFLTIPLSDRGIPGFVVYFFAFIGLVYILNPGSGFIEFLPDNLPVVGNIDEGGAYAALWYGLIEFFEGRKNKKTKKED